MATQLPTFSVSDSQAAELLAIFGDVDAYRAWLKRELYVKVIKARRDAATAASLESTATEFSDLAPAPPVE